MKKLVFIGIGCLLITSIALFAQNNANTIPYNEQVAQWEKRAEQGDTASLHRLIEYLDACLPIYVEVEEVIEAVDDDVDSVIVTDDEPALSHERIEYFSQKFEYWLVKGMEINDPVALATLGMRLYYEDEAVAIELLKKAADAGNGKAALFCGSACMNQQRENEAFKYLSLAYQLGVPSAGWYLAMCYSAGIGTEPDKGQAIEVMRHAAIMNYPEAVSEMRRIEPNNPTWKHKADSLNIKFPDFPIIPD